MLPWIAVVADPSLIFNAKKQGKTTHAIVIGVGWYPHLPKGGGKQLADPQGLTQLTSPIASARAFATWLLSEFTSADRPLSTVRFLTSEKKPKPFANPKTGEARPPTPATFAAIETAVKGWYDEGMKEEGSLLVFYYCGHGLGSESTMTLLPQDFAADPDNVLDTAIDFSTLRRGMNQCKAQNQAFFIDACRSQTDITRYSPTFAGRPIKSPSALTTEKQQTVFWSTRAGANAQGAKNKTSFYTETFLAGLRGMGADNSLAPWKVSTVSLAGAIKIDMQRRSLNQAPPAEPNDLFVINDIVGAPKVPVSVLCLPEALRPKVKLSCRLADKVVLAQKKPDPKPWVIEVDAMTEYVFGVVDTAGKALSIDKPKATIAPPGRAVELKVKP